MPVYNSNLWKYLKLSYDTNIKITMASRYEFFDKISNGITYIQSRGFKHLDIKLSNIMLSTDSTGKWDQHNCVITDFGIGGKKEKEVGNKGTPGFASPEQMIGSATEKSDNFSLGRVMIFLFATWQSAWNLSFQPVSDTDLTNFTIGRIHRQIVEIIQKLLQVGSISLYLLQTLLKT